MPLPSVQMGQIQPATRRGQPRGTPLFHKQRSRFSVCRHISALSRQGSRTPLPTCPAATISYEESNSPIEAGQHTGRTHPEQKRWTAPFILRWVWFIRAAAPDVQLGPTGRLGLWGLGLWGLGLVSGRVCGNLGYSDALEPHPPKKSQAPYCGLSPQPERTCTHTHTIRRSCGVGLQDQAHGGCSSVG